MIFAASVNPPKEPPKEARLKKPRHFFMALCTGDIRSSPVNPIPPPSPSLVLHEQFYHVHIAELCSYVKRTLAVGVAVRLGGRIVLGPLCAILRNHSGAP